MTTPFSGSSSRCPVTSAPTARPRDEVRKGIRKYPEPKSQAMVLNEKGIKVPRARQKSSTRTPMRVPPVLVAALKKNAMARKHFEAFVPSARHEYIEWITEARTDATRQRRVATTIAQVAKGLRRNWKYESKKA